jgi:hypothetical protein
METPSVHPMSDTPPTAAEAFYELFAAASDLGLRSDPTESEPYRIIPEGDSKDLPKRMFRLVQAIEALEEADRGEVNQILEAPVTQLSMKLAIYSIFGWINAQGLSTKEVSQMVLTAVNGPVKPNGSLAKLQMERARTVAAMGAAAPHMGPG